ncbi:hypothetical protein CDAR_285871 [Caerostris darwini]|uniref:Uncharacterized protein n=1 Tax=Caerostris darwini TaxID=1538125 RepID=A0AAV4U815_9ARAC|nr:hypothetical protein CDAR_496251 [Caerostris darwini]GIY77365.1 hypothetical protein CDAR_285871 [Caerostris darwini]
MAFFTAVYTSALNPFEQPCTHISALIQHCPNLSIYKHILPNSPGPSKGPTIYDPTKENYTISINSESRHCGIKDSEISRFQEKGYDAVVTARQFDRS